MGLFHSQARRHVISSAIEVYILKHSENILYASAYDEKTSLPVIGIKRQIYKIA